MTTSATLLIEHVVASENNKYLRINTAIDTLDAALFSKLDVNCAAGGTINVTAAQLRAYGFINLTGAPAANFTLALGAVNRNILIYNGTGKTATVQAGTPGTTQSLSTGTMATYRIETNNVYTTTGSLPANAVKTDATSTVTVGYKATAYNNGTKSSGTFTLDPTLSNFQYAVNGGAHTLDVSASGDWSVMLQYTNNGSAGTITLSGATYQAGDALTTTNGDDFMLNIIKVNGFVFVGRQKLQ